MRGRLRLELASRPRPPQGSVQLDEVMGLSFVNEHKTVLDIAVNEPRVRRFINHGYVSSFGTQQLPSVPLNLWMDCAV